VIGERLDHQSRSESSGFFIACKSGKSGLTAENAESAEKSGKCGGDRCFCEGVNSFNAEENKPEESAMHTMSLRGVTSQA
jgi:hypothetical protein